MLQPVVARVLESFVADLMTALPRILDALLFLLVATVVVKTILRVVGYFLRRVLPGESPVYHQFISTIVAIFLWFGVALSTLSILGLTVIAASLGTATGFLALGISFALSGMIADAVAGVYLLRDPDFEPGDTVTAGDVTGEVLTIELRKTRLRVGDDTVVRANAEIEQQWRKHAGPVDTSPVDTGPGDADPVE